MLKLKATTKSKKGTNAMISSNVAFTNKNFNKILQKYSNKTIPSPEKTFNKKKSKRVRKRKGFKFNSVLEFWDTFKTNKDCIKYIRRAYVGWDTMTVHLRFISVKMESTNVKTQINVLRFSMVQYFKVQKYLYEHGSTTCIFLLILKMVNWHDRLQKIYIYSTTEH